MQEESSETWTPGERLKFLRLKRQCNWADIAKDIELSEGMIYAVIAGKKFLSDKAVWRLAELERAAGIEPPDTVQSISGAMSGQGVPLRTGAATRDRALKILEQIQKLTAELQRLHRSEPAEEVSSGKSPAAKSAAALARVAALRKTSPAK